MKISTLLFLLLFLAFSPQTRAADKIVKDNFEFQTKKRNYYLYLPENIKGPAPLIVMLHGSGRDGLSLVEKWKDLASKEGVIIVGPDALNPATWSFIDDGPGFLHALVELLKSKYPINARRVYLFGHSGGAVMSISMSMLESEYFAATAIHAGAWRQSNEYQLIDKAKRKIPLAIWVGTNDQFFSLDAVHHTRDALLKAGFAVEVTEMPGHDHWYYDLAPKINQNAWDFLKKYQLDSDQRFFDYEVSDEDKDLATAGVLIKESDELRKNANDLRNQANTKDQQIAALNFVTQRADVNKLASEEIELLKQSAALWTAAAEKAQGAMVLKLTERNHHYVELVIKNSRKNAEIVAALRQEAEAVIGSDSAEDVNKKRAEPTSRVENLQKEADDLQEQMRKP